MKRKPIPHVTAAALKDSAGKPLSEAGLLKSEAKKERQKKTEANKAKHGAHHDMSGPGRMAADRRKSNISRKR